MTDTKHDQFDTVLTLSGKYVSALIRVAAANAEFGHHRNAATFHEYQDSITQLKEIWRILKIEMRRLDQARHI